MKSSIEDAKRILEEAKLAQSLLESKFFSSLPICVACKTPIKIEDFKTKTQVSDYIITGFCANCSDKINEEIEIAKGKKICIICSKNIFSFNLKRIEYDIYVKTGACPDCANSISDGRLSKIGEQNE